MKIVKIGEKAKEPTKTWYDTGKFIRFKKRNIRFMIQPLHDTEGYRVWGTGTAISGPADKQLRKYCRNSLDIFIKRLEMVLN